MEKQSVAELPFSSINEKSRQRRESYNIIFYLLSRFASLSGTSIYNFAISFYVLHITGSGLGFALTLALGTIPAILCGPISGVISDRVDRKKLVIYMDVLSGLIIFTMLAASMLDQLSLMYIYITTVLLAICHTFFDTSIGASISNIVKVESLPRINSWNEMVTSLTNMIGPFLGGFVFALIDIRIFLLINGISFILSAILTKFVDFKFNLPPTEEHHTQKSPTNNFIDELKESFTYIKTEKWLKVLVVFFMFINFFMIFGITVPIPFIVNQVLQFSSIQFGIIEAMFPLGILIGAILFSVVGTKKNNFKKMIFSFVILDIGVLATGILTYPVIELSTSQYCAAISVLFFIISAAVPCIMIPINVVLQSMVPDYMRGRIFGLLGMLSTLLIPLASILSGILLDMIPAFALPFSSSLLLLISTLLMYRNKELRKLNF
ncbi:MFS transporter [Paenibacillus dauci]|uniref:MFS transporter n=1 Tax=Paenibacillus dauci TaxID=1567106 RepID=UPI000619325E|nr:MFS transporter [Paenibacillus dauci]